MDIARMILSELTLRKLPKIPSFSAHLGKIYWEAYKACRRQWDAEELEKIQEDRLRALVKYAYKNVGFYHRQFKLKGIKPEEIKSRDDLFKLPILKKEDLREHFVELLSDNVTLDECSFSRSSGSTGVPTLVITDKKSRIQESAAGLRQHLACGLRFGERFLYATGDLPRLPHIDYSYGFRRVHVFPFFHEDGSRDEMIDKHLAIFKKIRPAAIFGAPVFMTLLAQTVNDTGIADEICIKAIISSFELLDRDTRQFLENTFNCKVFDYYGASEGHIAWECQEHCGFHINADNVIVEILKNDEVAAEGETGDVVVTYLNNPAMPLIRYKIGDIGSITEEMCPCGRKLPLMKNIVGRSADIVVLPDGRLLLPTELVSVMNHYTKISNFQIIQENKRLIVVNYAKHLGFTSNILEEIKKEYGILLGNDIEVKLVSVDKIVLERSRKLRSVVSKVRLKK